MKTFLQSVAVVCLGAASLLAQSSSKARSVISSSTLPSKCSQGSIFFRTGTTNPGLYDCVATDTWRLIAIGGTFTGRGAYAAGTTYSALDLVSSGGTGWISLQGSNTGHTPGVAGSEAYWATPGPQGLKGDPGVKGDSGLKGDPGVKGDRGVKGDTGNPGAAGSSYDAAALGAVLLSTGLHTYDIGTGYAYTSGMRVRAAYDSDPTNYGEGLVTSYSGGIISLNIDRVVGASATYAGYKFSIAGDPGPAPSGSGIVKVLNGVVGVVSGASTNCVRVDGSSGACGTGGGSSAFSDLTGVPTDNTALNAALAAKQSTSAKDQNGGYVGRASDGSATVSGTLTAGALATPYTGVAQAVELKQGTAPTSPAANSFQLRAPTSIPTGYFWTLPGADAAGLVGSDGSGNLLIKGLQGSDTKVLTAGTVSGTAAPLCTDAQGGATTSGCPAAVLPTDSGNKVLATPVDGTSGLMTARALSVKDLPGAYYATATGSANAYVVAPTNAVTSYTTGEEYCWKANFINTGATTVAFSGLSPAVTVRKWSGGALVDLASGDIQNGSLVCGKHDGTYIQLTQGLNNNATATKFTTQQVLGYELPGTGASGVLQAADFSAAFAASINNGDAKTLTAAYCMSDAGNQTVVVSVGGSARFTIHCVASGSFSTATTDGTTGYIIAGSMTNTAIAGHAVLDVTGTANGTTKDVKLFAYGTIN